MKIVQGIAIGLEGIRIALCLREDVGHFQMGLGQDVHIRIGRLHGLKKGDGFGKVSLRLVTPAHPHQGLRQEVG